MYSSFPIPLSQGVKVNPVVGQYIEKYASSCRRTLSHQVNHVPTIHFDNLIDTLFWEVHYLVSISDTYLSKWYRDREKRFLKIFFIFMMKVLELCPLSFL